MTLYISLFKSLFGFKLSKSGSRLNDHGKMCAPRWEQWTCCKLPVSAFYKSTYLVLFKRNECICKVFVPYCFKELQQQISYTQGRYRVQWLPLCAGLLQGELIGFLSDINYGISNLKNLKRLVQSLNLKIKFNNKLPQVIMSLLFFFANS